MKCQLRKAVFSNCFVYILKTLHGFVSLCKNTNYFQMATRKQKNQTKGAPQK